MCKVHGPVKSLRFYRPTLRKLRFQRSRGAALRDMRAWRGTREVVSQVKINLINGLFTTNRNLKYCNDCSATALSYLTCIRAP